MLENSPLAKAQNAIDLGSMEDTLRCGLGHRIRDLRIWIEPHGLVVSGLARMYYDKQMAQHFVKELLGRDLADNRIVVGPAIEQIRANDIETSGAGPRDSRITAKHRPHFQRFSR